MYIYICMYMYMYTNRCIAQGISHEIIIFLAWLPSNIHSIQQLPQPQTSWIFGQASDHAFRAWCDPATGLEGDKERHIWI